MNIIAFGASTSQTSINKALATYAANQLPNGTVQVLDLNEFELPLFSEDTEKAIGKPENAQRFFDAIGSADALVISFAEHNGSYAAAYKNIFDWASRIDVKVFQNKPAIFLATSPGQRGAQSVLQSAIGSAPFFGANVVGSFSLPKFYDHFDVDKKTITDETLNQALAEVMKALTQ